MVERSAVIARRDFLHTVAAVLGSFGLIGVNVGRLTALPPTGPVSHQAEEKRYPFPAADGVSIDKDNSLIVARAAGRVYALSLACPHQNTALRWDDEDHEFRCPKHKSRYRDDGTFIDGRATRSMDRLAVRRDGMVLVVDVDALFRQDQQPTEWTAAFVAA